jgi:Kef-type K+ transport system membrane component KefB
MTYVGILIALGGLLAAAKSLLAHDAVGANVAGAALAFGFLLLAAFCMGRIFAAFRLPRIVAYLSTGILAGPYVLDLVSEPMLAKLQPVSGVAICLIALTAGGELNFRKIAPLFRVIRRITMIAVIGNCFLLAAVVIALRPLLPFLDGLDTFAIVAVAAMLGVAMSAQSPAVTMALIEETQSDGPLTGTILGVVVIADLVVIVLYAMASTLAQSALGGNAELGETAKTIAWEIFGSIFIGVIVGMLLALYLRRVQQGLALFVLLLCIVVSEVGRRIHLDPLIVMLAAGLFLENGSKAGASALVHHLEGASLPVYLVFFALAGATIHLDLLALLAIPAATVVVTRALGFFVGSKLATRGKDVDPMVARWTWAGLLPQAGLALALALLIRRSFPELGEAMSALCFAVVAINEMVMPVVMRHALVASGEAGKRGERELFAPSVPPPPASSEAK